MTRSTTHMLLLGLGLLVCTVISTTVSLTWPWMLGMFVGSLALMATMRRDPA